MIKACVGVAWIVVQVTYVEKLAKSIQVTNVKRVFVKVNYVLWSLSIANESTLPPRTLHTLLIVIYLHY
jgi:hypothetical protein